MAYCYEQGIAHSEFLEVWSPADRAKVIAYALEKGERCGQCGTAAWEWEQDSGAYVAVRQSCPGCAHRERVRDDESAKAAPGVSVVLLPRSAAEAIAQNPEAFQMDGPTQRRQRRAEVLATRQLRP